MGHETPRFYGTDWGSQESYSIIIYPCGCEAHGSGCLPNYCAEHGQAELKRSVFQKLIEWLAGD